MRMALTGSSGKIGSVVESELREHGHDAAGLDAIGQRGPGFLRIELTDYGQVLNALGGLDRSPGSTRSFILARFLPPKILTDEATFHNGEQRWPVPTREPPAPLGNGGGISFQSGG